MPYVTRDGTTRCLLCGQTITGDWRKKAEHDRWHIEQREER
jgi:hypothetical protein